MVPVSLHGLPVYISVVLHIRFQECKYWNVVDGVLESVSSDWLNPCIMW